MTPERPPDEIQVEYIPLDFLDENAPNFEESGMDEIETWFDKLVEEGIITQDVMDERINQIEESRGIESEDKA